MTRLTQYANLKLMDNYELTCLFSSALDEFERTELAEKIKSLLAKCEGELVNSSPLSEVNLGYPLKNQSRAYMLIIDFKAKPEKIEEVKKELYGENQLLRFFLTKREKGLARPAPKRQMETRETGESEQKRKIRLKEIDKKIEEILSPSGKPSEEKTESEGETEGNKQKNELE